MTYFLFGPRRRVAATLTNPLDPFEVGEKLHQVEQVEAMLDAFCPGCGVPMDVSHSLDCTIAPDDLLDLAREEAIQLGMPE